jgi:GAF domain-containing protein
MTLQDISGKPGVADRSQLFLRFCNTLGTHAHVQALFEAVARLVPDLINAQGAAVLLLDTQTTTFYAPAACFDEARLTERFKTNRFSADTDTAGEVLRSGRSLIVHEYKDSSYILGQDNRSLWAFIQNRLDTPLRRGQRIIGVLSAINKSNEPFNASDVELLDAVCAVTALAMDNLGFQEKLIRSDHYMRDFKHAKDSVIDHISHTLKTPTAVLIASLKLLERHLLLLPEDKWRSIFHRAQRNLDRLLSIEYEVEDILRRQGDYDPYSQFTKNGPIGGNGSSSAKGRHSGPI